MSKNFLDDLIKKTSRSRRPRDLEIRSSFSDTRHGNKSLSEKLLFDNTDKKDDTTEIKDSTDNKLYAEFLSNLSKSDLLDSDNSDDAIDDVCDVLACDPQNSDSEDFQDADLTSVNDLQKDNLNDDTDVGESNSLDLSDILRSMRYDKSSKSQVDSAKLSDKVSADIQGISRDSSISSQNSAKVFKRVTNKLSATKQYEELKSSLEDMRASRSSAISSIRNIVNPSTWEVNSELLESEDTDVVCEYSALGESDLDDLVKCDKQNSSVQKNDQKLSEDVSNEVIDVSAILFSNKNSDTSKIMESDDLSVESNADDSCQSDSKSSEVYMKSFNDESTVIDTSQITQIGLTDIVQSNCQMQDDWVLDESYSSFDFSELNLANHDEIAQSCTSEQLVDWQLSDKSVLDDFDTQLRADLLDTTNGEDKTLCVSNSDDINDLEGLVNYRSYLRDILDLLSDVEKTYYYMGASRIRSKNCVMKIVDFFGNPNRSLTGISLDNRVVIYLLFFTVVAEFVEEYSIDPNDIYAILFDALGVINYREVLFIEVDSQLERIFSKYKLSNKNSANLQSIFNLMHRSIKELGL